ncbi:3-phosphoshikimate 1-carboxyvinyltransferase [Stutzerimonas balearica]|uniref:3-phosphoshikimate 1-carboxyvinyltransferase n=1 Tax=Stutzerimonas balearica TaxID=74829 RepID=UPI0022AE6CB8|nr:3-phosphoshikimate 1-carboxyvinyltransferase [Stutzerimonas balearica]MCZ4127873.1 3-phosphoshikimate 1-carboxyvinyltransferase [Stutzerimonas balearica]
MESPQPGRDEQVPYPSPFGADAVRQDAFTQGLLERLPEHLRDSFSDEQLEALRGIFGTRSWVRHRLDLRGTLKLFGNHYYFAILAGRNKRNLSRPQQNLSLAAKAALITLFLVFSAAVGLVILYLLKSALGIDLIPGFSFGLWDWFKANL